MGLIELNVGIVWGCEKQYDQPAKINAAFAFLQDFIYVVISRGKEERVLVRLQDDETTQI